MNIYAQRIQALRQEMSKHHIDAYLILTSDPHLSEYLPEFWKTRQWLSGFTGSAGSLLVTQDHASLWADGRYWLQAEKELQGSGIELQKTNTNHTYLAWILAWMTHNLKAGSVVASDAKVLPLALAKDIESNLKQKQIEFKTQVELISSLWLQDRPTLPQALIYEHHIAPRTRQEKLAIVRESMKKIDATHHFISTLDDIAWIMNLRGSDVPYNPVFLAHLLIGLEECVLFVDMQKIPDTLMKTLTHEGIIIKPYDQTETHLSTLKDSSILIDPSKMTLHFANILQISNTLIEDLNPSSMLKSCKNEAELNHIRQAMEQDGIALCHFFVWLEEALNNKQRISECDIDTQLSFFRSKNPHYISDSFSTIAGFNGNGAQPHYRATEKEFSYIEGDGLLLIDSGAQYTNGTTDITRVVPIGKITAEHKRDYTLVLKAHIAMTLAVFPSDIPMPLLDAITRAPLWKEQLDYVHGTGHGVGYFLNVHEGPQVLSYYAPVLPKTKAKEGMITSIEPGLYRAGKWGVRLENLVANRRVKQPKETDFGEFLYFETLTLCPFERACIDTTLLTQEEKDWVNSYHKEVFKRLSPYLEDKALNWLQSKTKPI